MNPEIKHIYSMILKGIPIFDNSKTDLDNAARMIDRYMITIPADLYEKIQDYKNLCNSLQYIKTLGAVKVVK